MMQKLSTWEILVPYRMGNHDNSDPNKPKKKKNVPVPYHQLWDEKVRAISGGLTILRVAKGQWISGNGTLFKELMIPVRISATQEQIEEIIKFTAEHYEQEAIYCMLISENTLIYHRPKKYIPNITNDVKCTCGHRYISHFNNKEVCKCKYCGCDKFEEEKIP